MRLRVGIVVLAFLVPACARAPYVPPERVGEVATAPATGSIVVRVSGLRTNEGNVAFALFADGAAFDSGESPLRKGVVAASTDGCAWEVEVPRGAYALKVYHDRNGNGRLDFNKLGVPREPYGFSNDARGRFGPPSFEAARFSLQQARLELEVELR